MKVITVFNRKGGCGKSFLTILFASYLAYVLHKKIVVYDFEDNADHLIGCRKDELQSLKDSGSVLSRYMSKHGTQGKPYEVRQLSRDALSKGLEYVSEVIRFDLDELRKAGVDYVFMDFEAGFRPDSVMSALGLKGYIDQVFVPLYFVDSVLRDGMNTGNLFKGYFHADVAMFFTHMTDVRYRRFLEYHAGASSPALSGLYHEFESRGFRMMKSGLKLYASVTGDQSLLNFVVSTVCFPEDNIRRNCTGMMDWLEEATGILEGR